MEAQDAIMRLRPALIEAYDDEIERPRGSGTPEIERRNGAAVVPEPDVKSVFDEAMQRTTEGAMEAGSTTRPTAAAAAAATPKRRGGGSSAAYLAASESSNKRPAPPAEPEGLTPIQAVKRPKTTVDHTYRDFSRVLETALDIDSFHAVDSFPSKLHEVLADSDSYGEYISWRPHGRAFAILKPKQMESAVLGKFFGHGRYSTFLRQLKEHGFKQITQGPDRSCFYHETFLRGLPHLVRYMPPPKTNRRRQAADPFNEPDLSLISKLFPLPEAFAAAALDDDRKLPAAPAAYGASLSVGGLRPESPTSRAESKSAELCMARAAAAASLAAADPEAAHRARQQAAAAAEALRHEREAAAAAVSVIAARRRQQQLDLARSILLGTSSLGVGAAGLGPSLGSSSLGASPGLAAFGLPTAASAEAAIIAAMNGAGRPPAVASASLTGASSRNLSVDPGALMAAMAAEAAATSNVLGGVSASAVGPSLASLSGLTVAELMAFPQQIQHGGVGSALYHRFP